MKWISVGFVCALVAAGNLVAAPTDPAPVARPAAEVKPAAKPAPKKKAEPMGKIDGIEIARPSGAFLGLQLVNSNFVLSFYDAQKHRTTADVARATLRWAVKYQPQDERAVLNPSADGQSLTSAKTIRPPHSFKVFLALFVEGNDSAVESYSVDVGR